MTTEKQKGLYGKYIIRRADGTPIDPEDEYFVMKVAGKGDRKHIGACRRAIIKYAHEIADHLPYLSRSILDRYDHVEKEDRKDFNTKRKFVENLFPRLKGTYHIKVIVDKWRDLEGDCRKLGDLKNIFYWSGGGETEFIFENEKIRY